MPRGGGGPTTYNCFYRVTYVPEGCEDYHVGDLIGQNLPDPKPQTITLQLNGPCNGVVMERVA